jgi:hypothetical protein
MDAGIQRPWMAIYPSTQILKQAFTCRPVTVLGLDFGILAEMTGFRVEMLRASPPAGPPRFLAACGIGRG